MRRTGRGIHEADSSLCHSVLPKLHLAVPPAHVQVSTHLLRVRDGGDRAVRRAARRMDGGAEDTQVSSVA